MGSWTGPAEANETQEMKESILERTVVNSVLLKCRKLRREDQETSDSIVGFFIEKPQCDGRLQSSKISLSNFYRVSL